MKTNSKSKTEKSLIEKQIKGIPFKKLSKQSGFCKRKPKKISPKNLLLAFMLTIWGSKHNTYSCWASTIGLLTNQTVSKQAVSKRVTEEMVLFLSYVLQTIIRESVSIKQNEKTAECLKQFKRVIIEDSTTIHLDNKLSKEYPGSKNQFRKDYATMKIQAAYEILNRKFLRFEITSFRDNDQSYAGKIIEITKPGDLVIRDLGYFASGVFNRLDQQGVNYISRLTKTVNIYEKPEEKPIDLAKMLKKRGELDIEVFIGAEAKTPVRLIAIPLEEHEASKRRRKAKASRDHGYHIRKKTLFLLGWILLITNIPKEKMLSLDIAKTYSLRWRIEIIFKCWKSILKIKNIPPDANKARMESFIYCMLIFILLFQVHYYLYYSNKRIIKDSSAKTMQLSLMKLMQYIVNNITLIYYSNHFTNHSVNYLFRKQISYYCKYESRTDRVNYAQLLQN